jgi:hypothetical protein
MTGDTDRFRKEIERVHRVADMLCTGHAGLRDRYGRRALFLDLVVLGLSTWLVALAFVQPEVSFSLTPFELNPRLWGGLLAVGTFFLTIVQLKTDFKGRSEAHRRALHLYAGAKREAGYILASGAFEEAACRRALASYDIASSAGIEMPEHEFLRQKGRHSRKIELSKHLDSFPSASIPIMRIRFWFRDNLWGGKVDR